MTRRIFYLDEQFWMNEIPLILLIVINIFIVVFVISYLNRQKKMKPWLGEIIGYLGILCATWLGFSIVWGLIISFDVLEQTGNRYVLRAFASGFSVAMRIMMLGLVVACIPLVLYLKITSRDETSRAIKS